MRFGGNFVILLVAIAMGGVAAYLAREWLTSHSAAVAVVEPSSVIVVATAPLAFGAPITADTAAEIPWPAKTIPDGAFTKLSDLTKDGRRVALSPFVRNEPIIGSKVSAPNQRASLSAVIEEGKRAVTVAVDDVRGVAGFIFPGDFVDVVLTRTNNADSRDFSEVILQHVKVLAIDQLAGERAADRPTVAKAVTVELTPDQSLKILLAMNTGKLSLILRQPSEDATAARRRVTESDLFGADASRDAAAPTAPGAPQVEAKAVVAPPPVVEPTTRKVTIVRALKGEDYDVPKDAK